MILSFALGIIGFISVLAVLIGLVLGIVFLILWLTGKPEKKRKYKKIMLIFLATFLAGFLLNILTLASYAVLSNKENIETPLTTVTQDLNNTTPKSEEPTTPATNTEELSILQKLKQLAQNTKTVDPETFSYPGCKMYHGEDGKISNWETFNNDPLEKIYSYLSNGSSKFSLITLDYPNDNSDSIYIVTCTCETRDMVQTETTQLGLKFNNTLQHYPLLLCTPQTK